MSIVKTKVTAVTREVPYPLYSIMSGSRSPGMTFPIDITIGDIEHVAYGEASCGWLRDDAKHDIDYSDLPGDVVYRPNEWRVVVGDTHSTGHPEITHTRSGETPDNPIVIRGACETVISHHHIPEWAYAVRAWQTNDAYSKSSLEYYRAMYIRSEIIQSLSDAIGDISAPLILEPEASDLWRESRDTMSKYIRVSNHRSGGVCLVWRSGDTYHFKPHPVEDDVAHTVNAIHKNDQYTYIADIRKIIQLHAGQVPTE